MWGVVATNRVNNRPPSHCYLHDLVQFQAPVSHADETSISRPVLEHDRARPRSRMSCLLSSAHAAESNLPAVLLAGCEGATCGYEVATRLFQAGFASMPTMNRSASARLLWKGSASTARLSSSVSAMPMPICRWAKQKTVDALNRYLDAGGGVLVMGFFSQQHVLAVDGQSSHCLARRSGATWCPAFRSQSRI